MLESLEKTVQDVERSRTPIRQLNKTRCPYPRSGILLQSRSDEVNLPRAESSGISRSLVFSWSMRNRYRSISVVEYTTSNPTVGVRTKKTSKWRERQNKFSHMVYLGWTRVNHGGKFQRRFDCLNSGRKSARWTHMTCEYIEVNNGLINKYQCLRWLNIGVIVRGKFYELSVS